MLDSSQLWQLGGVILCAVLLWALLMGLVCEWIAGWFDRRREAREARTVVQQRQEWTAADD